MAQPSKMIVGLGNPGADYSFNRHNIGFMALDAVAKEAGIGTWQKKYKGLMASGTLGGIPLLFLKPQTYMNLSGESVGDAMRFFKLSPNDVIVFHDDIDLQAGQVKAKQGGGHAGHNGLRSLDAHIGKDYWRVRLGVGRPNGFGDVSDHVLGDFTKADNVWLMPLLGDLPGALPLLFSAKPDIGTFVQKMTRK